MNNPDNFLLIEMNGPTDNRTLATMTSTELEPYGCYTNVDSITYVKRLGIINAAKDLVADAAGIDYTAFDALRCKDPIWTYDWDGTVEDIGGLRCDGLIEACYEMNNIDVWAMERHYNGTNSLNYDISNQSDTFFYDTIAHVWFIQPNGNFAKDNLEEHNDFDDIGWTDTLMPATQCGHATLSSDTSTTFTAQDLCVPVGHSGGN